MIIYADILFIINFISDYLILTLTDTGKRISVKRRLLGAGTGAVYSCLYIIKPDNIAFGVFGVILVFLLMCFICTKGLGFGYYIKYVINSFSVSALFLGIICMISITLMGEIPSGIHDMVYLSGICTTFLFVRLSVRLVGKLPQNLHHTVTIFYDNKSCVLYAMTDSGNLLTDFVSGKPVSVADISALKNLFPALEKPVQLCEMVKPESFRTIPYKTVSGHGILYGFIPDRVTVDKKTVGKIIICAAPEGLSCDMLINPSVF